jgi:hypothetical protein
MRTMKCSRTYEWDGIDGGKTYIEKEESMFAASASAASGRPGIEEDDDEEHMQKFKPKTPPMLYGAMFNQK